MEGVKEVTDRGRLLVLGDWCNMRLRCVLVGADFNFEIPASLHSVVSVLLFSGGFWKYMVFSCVGGCMRALGFTAVRGTIMQLIICVCVPPVGIG